MGWMGAAGGVGSIAGTEGGSRISEEGPDEIVVGTNRCGVRFAVASHSQGTNISAIRLLAVTKESPKTLR